MSETRVPLVTYQSNQSNVTLLPAIRSISHLVKKLTSLIPNVLGSNLVTKLVAAAGWTLPFNT